MLDSVSSEKMLILLGCLLLFGLLQRLLPLQPGLVAAGSKGWLHAARNFGLAGIGAATSALLSLFTLLQLIALNSEWQFGLLYWLEASVLQNTPDGLRAALLALLAFMLFDLWQYGWHRANHRIAFLWRFHAIHHADRSMGVSTGLRFHFVELGLSTLLRIPVLLLLGMKIEHLLLYELVALPVVLFHHANLRTPESLDRVMRSLIVTPRMHRVHHRVESENCNSNYSSVLSLWDRIFGSWRQPGQLQNAVLGLENLQVEGLGEMLLQPFRKR